MSHPVKDAYPLYVIRDCLEHNSYIRSEDVVLITASFTFARIFKDRFGSRVGRELHITRVVYTNRLLPVTRQSSHFVARLDSSWCRPPSMLALSFCQLCFLPDRWVGVSISNKEGSPCPLHPTHWAPQFNHERVRLNSFNPCWHESKTQGALQALRSAKLELIGPLYFARSMSAALPVEVLNLILAQAAYQSELPLT